MKKLHQWKTNKNKNKDKKIDETHPVNKNKALLIELKKLEEKLEYT